MENIEDMYVASPMQQGLIFHGLYAPSLADYLVQIICEIEGELEPSILARAWQHLINHYSILRTFFVWEEVEEVLQVVCREAELPSCGMDWRDLTKSEQQSQLQALIDDDRAQGFDLMQAPLMRLTVIRLDARLYTLIWSHHHVLLDGWSAFLIFRQSFELYEAYIKGNDLRLEPSRPYRDYIAWLQKQDMSAAERFWREKLKGYSNSTPLTGERRLRKAGHDQSVVSEQQRDGPRLYLSVETTAALKQLARQQQLTLNTLLMGAWALVLSRHTGEPDVLFGTVVACRPASLRGVETMVGPLINLLPLRLKIERHSLLLSWLKAVQAEHAEVRSYDYSPLVQVQAWSDAPRGTPLFETIMVFENYPVDASSFERDVSLRITQAKTLTKTNYPLSFEVTPCLQSLMLQLSYDSAYFDRESVERMLGHAGQLLAEMVANPEARIGELSLETVEEPDTIGLPAERVSEQEDKQVEDIYPLSPMQEVMLAQSLLSPSSGVYIPQLVFGLGGEIDLTVFEQAWVRLVERHSILRTSFVLEGLENPMQVVNEKVSLPLEYYDWRSYSSHAQQSRSLRLINENLKRGFDLTQPPLMRLTLIHMKESCYRFIWSCHHLLLDGWSCTLIFNEFFALYKSLAEGADLQLEPARPYRGYIDWVQQQDLTETEKFWRQTLRGFTRPTQLLIDRAHGDGFHIDDEPERAYGDLRLELPEATMTRLRERARKHHLTLNTLVQGAWALLLARYSREEEVMFGTIVSGRPHELAGVEEVPGLFINALPARVRVSPEASLLAWLQELQATQVELRCYEQSRLADVQRWSELPANAPLFESLIRFQNFPRNPALQASDNGQTETVVQSIDWWHYPLCLAVVLERQMLLHISYERRRFESGAVRELLETLRELLESMSVDLSHQALEHLLLTKAGK